MKQRRLLSRLLCLSLFALICAPLQISAAELTVQSETLIRTFQRDTQSQNDAAVIPAYEYLKVDVGNAGEPGLSFHAYGWGRLDLADNDYFEKSSSGELLYAYLEYQQQQAAFNLRLGRQYVFEGVASESIDGLRLSSDLGKYFSGSIYAGQQVALADENGRSGDSIYGGRLANRMGGLYDLGISYKKISNDSDDAEELAGLDLAAYLPLGINLHGFSTYNLISDAWAEHSYELNANFGSVSVRPFLQQFQYDDYFNTGTNSANPFRFLATTGEELTIIGADLIVPATDAVMLVGKIKNYDYKVFDDSSQYFSAQATWSGENLSQVGGEAGYMLGDAAQNEYYLLRFFTYIDQPFSSGLVDFISSDLVYVGYDQEIAGEDSSLFLSLGTGKRFMDDALELKVSADYSKDPYFDMDLRGMLTASYNFGKSL